MGDGTAEVTASTKTFENSSLAQGARQLKRKVNKGVGNRTCDKNTMKYFNARTSDGIINAILRPLCHVRINLECSTRPSQLAGNL